MSGSISVDFIGHQFSETAEIVLADIKISVKAGELVSLIGRSGCGKSTLLHIISGLLAPASGCVRIDGKTVTKPSAKWNMMFQKASLFPWMTVQENVGLGLKFAGASKGQIAQKTDELLELVGLKDKAQDSSQSLSGGQQQRVALARSLFVMDQNPGRIIDEIKVDIAWPRKHMSQNFQRIREDLMIAFKGTEKTESFRSLDGGRYTADSSAA